MEVFDFAIMLVSIVIAWQTWRNGQWLKEMLKTINEQGEQRHPKLAIKILLQLWKSASLY